MGDVDACRAAGEALFVRFEWDEPQKFRLTDCHQSFNLAGLYWLPIRDTRQTWLH